MAEKKKRPASETKDTKEALQRRLEVQLEEWNAAIDRLRAEAERKEFDEQIRRKYYEQVQELRDRVSDAADKLQQLKKSGEDTWNTLKKDLEKTWTDLKKAFERSDAST